MTAAPTIAVCIATYQRPAQLRELLESLAAQALPGDAPAVRVVVVDNDEAESARGVTDAAHMPWPITYAVEPRKGLSTVRNRLIELAGDADFVVFVDDDEIAPTQWLATLLRVERETNAAVVTGPVKPRFPAGAPNWMLRGSFHGNERRDRAPGARLPAAASNNTLVRGEVFGAMALRFDERFNRSGGEDSLLFRQVVARGGEIVWATDAFVEEVVLPDRVGVRWVLGRAFREGNIVARCEKEMRPGARTFVVGVIKSWGRVFVGAASGVVALVRADLAGAIGGLRRMFVGFGGLAARAGYTFEQY
jgi:glycosyltransferase involved in cell wall biosynthesis